MSTDTAHKIYKRPKDDIPDDESKINAKQSVESVEIDLETKVPDYDAQNVKPFGNVLYDYVLPSSNKGLPLKKPQDAINEILIEIQNDKEIKKRGIKKVHLILYVHGFNNKTDSIVKRLKHIDEQLGTNKVVTLSFNWKCTTAWSGIPSHYKDDKHEVEYMVQYFVPFLAQLRLLGFQHLDIIAHSMGNYMLTLFIEQCAKYGSLADILCGSQIVSFAADVEIERFKNVVKKCQKEVKNLVKWTHYYNSDDNALKASEYSNNDKRAGKHAISGNNILDSIEC
eukprot:UN04951